ncbi:amidase [Arvimicrobium flavum]|uniref:amidase n=1 Tax=Arvimicrobium flavum TaxID=3393320 RepID=UPI00237B9FD7|nr:amidase [Mesorhizobium shangrilense]
MNPQLTISQASRLLAEGKISAVELTKDCLSRISQFDGQLNCFIHVTDERALADAKASDARRKRGETLGRLDGIPIAHKDIYNTAGIATTAHSRLLQANVPSVDAHCVMQLADAGTVLLGKLSTFEFAMGGPIRHSDWPPAKNPWNPAHMPGGSSSGSAAAVAAGFVLGATGSDSGGSVRIPAALCGTAGIKPTQGLVSTAGIMPLTPSLDHPGVLAWTTEDCAILFDALTGAGSSFADGLEGGCHLLEGIRVGVIDHFHKVDHPVDYATQTAISNCLASMARCGARIGTVKLSPLWDYHACGFIILLAEAFCLHESWLKTRFHEYSDVFRDRAVLGAAISSSEYLNALRQRSALRMEMDRAMSDADILVTAVQAGEAQHFKNYDKWAMLERPSLTMPFNLTGFPSISICCGYGPKGLPLAIQIAAKPGCDELLLRVASRLEKQIEGRRRPKLC